MVEERGKAGKKFLYDTSEKEMYAWSYDVRVNKIRRHQELQSKMVIWCLSIREIFDTVFPGSCKDVNEVKISHPSEQILLCVFAGFNNSSGPVLT